MFYFEGVGFIGNFINVTAHLPASDHLRIQLPHSAACIGQALLCTGHMKEE